ncbi:MAG: hypothetical protein H0W02_08010 [Ktedonobacteraceae bacterium]|nr:hypothetical protein [Ktedonobacteraceae bacterium]
MSKQGTRQPAKQPVGSSAKSLKQTRQDKRREEQLRREEEQRQAARRKRIMLIGVLMVVALVVIVGAIWFVTGQNSQQANSAYPAVDGITCDQSEQSSVHYHAHLTIYIDGQRMLAPANTGVVNNSCLYWLHVHSADGVIHIEAPSARAYTLGNFLHIWQREFPYLDNGFPSQLNQSTGWTVYVNGKVYNGDFHKIVLQSHTLVTLAYDSPNAKPDTTYNWSGL